MSWIEKNKPTPFDTQPVPGLFYFDGNALANRYRKQWVRGRKYPVVTFPSGLQREMVASSQGDLLTIFGAFQLPRVGHRDTGLQHAIGFAQEYDYTVARRGERELLVLHSHSGHGYVITYDNQAGFIANVTRFPDHAMEFLDAESRAVLPPLYSNEHLGLEAIAPVKFFSPDSNWTWYPSEYDGKDIFFGLVSGFEVELGSFTLTELEGVSGGLALPIERDLYFTPRTLRELQQEHLQGRGGGL